MIAFMKQFSFATIITAKDEVPVATHLPFLVSVREEEIYLVSHFAKANPQWKDVTSNKVLVIFSEPHAYISPKNYDHNLNVPTWNYISIHAYGICTIIDQEEKVFEILSNTIENYEPSFINNWQSLPEDYKKKMVKGIVAFEIKVTELQGKKKLSQNKTETEKQRIIESLLKSENSNEKMIAEFMLKENKV